MSEWLLALLSAGSGFTGSCVLLWASWRSMYLRRAQHKAEAIDTDDATMRKAAEVLAKRLNVDHLNLIAGERRLYMLGIALLGLSFAITFLREIV